MPQEFHSDDTPLTTAAMVPIVGATKVPRHIFAYMDVRETKREKRRSPTLARADSTTLDTEQASSFHLLASYVPWLCPPRPCLLLALVSIYTYLTLAATNVASRPSVPDAGGGEAEVADEQQGARGVVSYGHPWAHYSGR
jgi:hypothetical protein